MATDTANEQTGTLAVHAENILPIIKKWLYSDKEIFLRELISNAMDAITKLKHVGLSEGLGELGDLAIDVRIDRDQGTLTVSDDGIGMSAEEIRQYIAQVAFSGAEEFVRRYEIDAEKNQIIGHFGLGFYSAFMVSSRVEVLSRSYRPDEPATRWVCDGGLEYTMAPTERTRGTDIILHLPEEDREYLETARIEHVIKKYCNYLPIAIRLDGKTLNDRAPLWTKTPQGLKDEDYLEFYRKAFPFEDDPLFWIHLNADYPFRLQGILYFPRFKHELDASKGQIQLFCNQVFVSDHADALIPRFLTVLRGMIDGPDIPLNVSRSALQNDPYVRKISTYITKKVADRLVTLFKSRRETFEKHWEDIHPFVKFGMMEDEKFHDAVQDIVLFETTRGGYTTLKDYLERNEARQGKQVYYAAKGDAQATYLQLLEAEGLEALYTQTVLDSHFIQFLEHKGPEIRWSRVDSSVSDLLVDRSHKAIVDAEGRSTDDRIADAFKSVLGQEADVEIQVQHLKSAEVPALVIQPEHARRLKEMSALLGEAMALPGRKTLVVNASSALVQKALAEVDSREDLCRQVYDLARLAHEGLSGDEMAQFIARSHRLLAR